MEDSSADAGGVPLYHLTDAARAASIRELGLDPEASREPAFRGRHIYLSHDARHALAYENHHGDWRGRPVLLRISSSELDPALLGPDDVDLPDLLEQEGNGRQWSDVSWVDSLRISGQCTYAGVIPASAISFLDGTDWMPMLGEAASATGRPGPSTRP